MNIIVIARFMWKDGANGLNWKSADRPEDSRKECKEMILQMFGKKAIGLVLGLFVCAVLIKPIKLFRKKGDSYQTAPAKE